MTVSLFLVSFDVERGGPVYTLAYGCADPNHSSMAVLSWLAAAGYGCDSVVEKIPLVKEDVLTEYSCCRPLTRSPL